MDAERLVRVQRGAGRLRVLGDQFQIAERGDRRDGERDQERQPGRPADLGGDLTGQRVDAGAEDVADDEQQQQSGPITRFSSGCSSTVACAMTPPW